MPCTIVIHPILISFLSTTTAARLRASLATARQATTVDDEESDSLSVVVAVVVHRYIGMGQVTHTNGTGSVTISMNIALFYRRDTHIATALIANQ